MPQRLVKILIVIYICISLIGFMAHMTLHPVTKSLYFWLASPMSVVSLLIIPLLFLRSATVAWGFMLNGFVVGAGTVGMSYFSMLNMEGPLTFYRLIAESTLPAILFLWIKLPIAFVILHKMRPQETFQKMRGCAE